MHLLAVDFVILVLLLVLLQLLSIFVYKVQLLLKELLLLLLLGVLLDEILSWRLPYVSQDLILIYSCLKPIVSSLHDDFIRHLTIYFSLVVVPEDSILILLDLVVTANLLYE